MSNIIQQMEPSLRMCSKRIPTHWVCDCRAAQDSRPCTLSLLSFLHYFWFVIAMIHVHPHLNLHFFIIHHFQWACWPVKALSCSWRRCTNSMRLKGREIRCVWARPQRGKIQWERRWREGRRGGGGGDAHCYQLGSIWVQRLGRLPPPGLALCTRRRVPSNWLFSSLALCLFVSTNLSTKKVSLLHWSFVVFCFFCFNNCLDDLLCLQVWKSANHSSEGLILRGIRDERCWCRRSRL